MIKTLGLKFVLIISMLSLPAVSYALPSDPPVANTSSANVSGMFPILQGFTNRDGVIEHGFQYGPTSSYGSQVKETKELERYSYVSEFMSRGSGDGQLQAAQDIAYDASGNIYVADTNNNRIQKFDSSGNLLLKFGTNGTANGQMNGPSGIAIDANGNIYITDTDNYRVQKFDSDGNFVSKFGTIGSIDGRFLFPRAIAIDSAGNIYVGDQSTRIQKFNSSGVFVSKFGATGTGDGQLDGSGVRGIAIDSNENVFVTDSGNNRVQKFDSDGNFVSKFGTIGSETGQFKYPIGIDVDSDNNLFVVDTQNSRVQVFDSSGVFVSTFGTNGSKVGEFNSPNGIDVDPNGNIIIVDTSNSRVIRYVKNDPANTPFLLEAEVYCGNEFHYRAFVTNENGTTYGDDAIATTPDCLDGPFNLTGTATARTINLNWNGGPNDFIGYARIAYRKQGSQTWINNDNNGMGEGLISEGIEPGTTYSIRVTVMTIDWNDPNETEQYTAWSNEFEITTLPEGTFTISSCRDLQAIGYDPSTGLTGDLEGHYVLDRDIDCADSVNWVWGTNVDAPGVGIMTGAGFFPIFDTENGTSTGPEGFRGVLDGQGHSVSNLYQKSSLLAGIFGTLDGATIANTSFENLTIEADSDAKYVGGISSIAYNGASIQNVSVNGSIDSITDSDMRVASNRNGGLSSFTVGPNDKTYFSIYGNIVVANSDGEQQSTFGGNEIVYGSGVTVDSSGNTFVTDNSLDKMFKFDQQGNEIEQFSTTIQAAKKTWLGTTNGIDSLGNLYNVKAYSEGFQKFDNDGNFISEFGSRGSGDGQFEGPTGIAFDTNNNIYVADSQNDRIQKLDSNGNFISKFGSYGQSDLQYPENDDIDGNFNSPSDVAVDSAGNIYVSDSYNCRVQKFDSNGNYISQFGRYGDGEGEFVYTGDLSLDTAGNIYVLDQTRRVQKFDSNGNFIATITKTGAPQPRIGALVGGTSSHRGGGNVASLVVAQSSTNVAISRDVFSDVSQTVVIGGVLGYGNAHISDVYSVGPISLHDERTSSTATSMLGGIIGYGVNSIVERSYSTSALSTDGTTNSNLGGIIAFNSGSTIIDSYASGLNTGAAISGGVVGLGETDDDGNRPEFENTSFDQSATTQNNCASLASNAQGDPITIIDEMCKPINTDGLSPNYYFGDSPAPVFQSWNFDDVWLKNDSANPTLRPYVLGIEETNNSDGPGDSAESGGVNGTNENSFNDEIDSKKVAKKFAAAKNVNAVSEETGTGNSESSTNYDSSINYDSFKASPKLGDTATINSQSLKTNDLSTIFWFASLIVLILSVGFASWWMIFRKRNTNNT